MIPTSPPIEPKATLICPNSLLIPHPSSLDPRPSSLIPHHSSLLDLPSSQYCIMPIAQCLLPRALCPSLTAHYPMPIAWPGGMRGAIESAALGLKPRHGVSNPQPKSISSNSNLQISDPLISPPAPPRIPPGRPKTIIGLIFVIFISLGTGRAKCKKLMPVGP